MSPQPKILYTSQAEAEKKTGYFEIFSLKITPALFDKLNDYISREGLCTWVGGNQKRTSYNIYTLNFCLKLYGNGAAAYIDRRGALGDYKSVCKNWISPEKFEGMSGLSRRLWSIQISQQEKKTHLEEITPSLNQLYFWIARKYPNDILSMSYGTKNHFPNSFDFKGVPDDFPF